MTTTFKRMPFGWYVAMLLRGRNPWKEDRRLWELAQQPVEEGGIRFESKTPGSQ